MKKYLYFSALGYGAFLLINFFKKKAAAGQNLEITPIKISIDLPKTKKARYFKIYYDITLNLANREQATVNVKNIFLTVKTNDRNFGDIKENLNFVVPANGEKQISIKASFFTLGFLGLIKDLIQNGFNILVNVNGYIDTDLGRVNIDFSKNVGGEINGKRSVNGY
jgi:LEA14-like dessication related protein